MERRAASVDQINAFFHWARVEHLVQCAERRDGFKLLHLRVRDGEIGPAMCAMSDIEIENPNERISLTYLWYQIW